MPFFELVFDFGESIFMSTISSQYAEKVTTAGLIYLAIKY